MPLNPFLLFSLRLQRSPLCLPLTYSVWSQTLWLVLAPRFGFIIPLHHSGSPLTTEGSSWVYFSGYPISQLSILVRRQRNCPQSARKTASPLLFPHLHYFSGKKSAVRNDVSSVQHGFRWHTPILLPSPQPSYIWGRSIPGWQLCSRPGRQMVQVGQESGQQHESVSQEEKEGREEAGRKKSEEK